ncbi:MAG: dihydroxyacetone kinase subunit DhaK [Verrucomicrobia bacterium]|nr:dihydroxyacetone kinase subunit DhaK [Verrucomicrobiota bacterium]
MSSYSTQRIINDPNRVVEDMLQGFFKAHQGLVVPIPDNPRVVKYARAPIQGKVGVVTGGGSGHKPAFIGYVGKNLCDAVAVGEIFSSPSAQVFYDAFKAADGGAGIACLYGNYAGDNMNVKMAKQLAAMDGIEIKTVVANDDVASAPKDEPQKRRGVAGEVLMWKVGGAKAAQGGSLDEVIAAAQKAINQTRSIGVGLSPCTIPAVGKPNFSIKPGTMEVGIGHHGEPGVKVSELRTANEIAEMCLNDFILPDLPFGSGDEVVVLISGLGATPVMELYIAYSRAHDLLEQAGIKVHRAYVGNYFTSLEMMGITFTVLKLDDELKGLIDLEAESAGLTQLAR